MSTRCMIMKKVGEDTFLSNYCHFDGYLKGVGKTLWDNYKDEETVDRLFEHGRGFSVLEETPEKISFYDDVEGWEERAKPEKFVFSDENIKKDVWIEFYYVFDNGEWWVCDARYGAKLNKLKDELKRINMI